MKNLFLCFAIFAMIGCTTNKNSNANTVSNRFIVEFEKKASDFTGKYSATHEIYRYEDTEFVQIAAILRSKGDSVSFCLKTISKLMDDEATISGVAVSQNGDVEIDEDMNGIGYPVLEYIYSGDCWIALRLALESNDMLRINSDGCEEFIAEATSFTSNGILKKIN